MLDDLKNIDDFYSLLEKIEPTSDDLGKIPYRVDYLLNLIDNPDILKAETDCLKFKTEDGKLLPLHNYHDDKGNEVIIPNIRDFNDEIFNYIKDRQEKTNNIALKAKYGHILWHSKKDFEALKITIDSYLALTDLFAEKDKNEPDEHYGLSAIESFINAFSLSLPTKYNFEVVKNKTIELIYNYFPQSSSFHLLRVKLVELMVENKKHFEQKDFKGLQKICWEMALTYNGINFTTDFFNLGHKIDLITGKQTYEWDKAKAEYFEKLMKEAEASDNNLNAPTFCKEALDIYIKMNNKEKIAELEEKYTFLAQSQRLSTFETKPVDITESVNHYRSIANDFSYEQIIKF